MRIQICAANLLARGPAPRAIGDLTSAELTAAYRRGDFGDAWINWSPYTYPFNLTQQAAASVPSGLASNGLPMGVQIVGAVGADITVVRAARVLEQAMPIPRPQADK